MLARSGTSWWEGSWRWEPSGGRWTSMPDRCVSSHISLAKRAVCMAVRCADVKSLSPTAAYGSTQLQDAVLLLSSINLSGGVQRRRTLADQLKMRDYFVENDMISVWWHSSLCFVCSWLRLTGLLVFSCPGGCASFLPGRCHGAACTVVEVWQGTLVWLRLHASCSHVCHVASLPMDNLSPYPLRWW